MPKTEKSVPNTKDQLKEYTVVPSGKERMPRIGNCILFNNFFNSTKLMQTI